MTVRGDTRVGLGSRPDCVDWLGLWVEEDDGEGEEEEEEELEYREGGGLESLEGLETSWESHSCLSSCVAVATSEVKGPSAGQEEVEGFCTESATSEELIPFSAREPETWRG